MKKIINKYRNWNPSTYATILLLLTPFLAFLYKNFVLDNDFWFLINTGKEILKDGFIHVEPFTIHEGLNFIPQQWLTDIIFYIIYDTFDIKGMFYLTIICNGIIIFLFYKISYLMNSNNKKSLIITVFSDLFLIISGILTTRPQMFDIILFSLELYFIELYIKSTKKKYLYFIPLISLLLINIHASMWVMLFVFMVPYYVEYFYLKIKKRKRMEIKPLIIITIITFLVGFINPYGIDAITYLFKSYGFSKINSVVAEMQSVSIDNFSGKFIYLIIATVFYSFYFNKGKNKIRYFLLSIGTIYLGLSHFKGVIYLIIILPLVLSYNFRINGDYYNKMNILLYEKIVYLLFMIVFMFFIGFKTKLSKGESLIEFANYLDANATKDIKLYTNYNDGGYMEYRGYKCYIDARAEVFVEKNNQKEDIFDEWFDIENGKLTVIEFSNKYNFDYLLVDSDENMFLKELLNSENHAIVYQSITDKQSDIIHYLFKKIK